MKSLKDRGENRFGIIAECAPGLSEHTRKRARDAVGSSDGCSNVIMVIVRDKPL
jgi:hypothetical protein